MTEFKVPVLPKTQGQFEQSLMSVDVGIDVVNVESRAHKIEDDVASSSSSASPIAIFNDGGLTMHGYTAAQYAALAPVNGLDLQCKVCRRLMVDPLTTMCNHTMCTRCFNVSTVNNQPEPCPVCGNTFGPVSIWYFNQAGYDEATKSIHLSRNNLLEEYFTSPMVRGRFDCINQINEMTDPKEVYELFRDIFWFFKNPENDQLIQRAYAHTFLRIMTMRLKKRINEEIKRVFQMEVELGYLNRYNNYADAKLMEAFIEDFPDRAQKSTSIFTTTDSTGNQVTRSTVFPDYFPEKMVTTHLPCNREHSAIVCTVPEALPVDHGAVEINGTQIVAALAQNDCRTDPPTETFEDMSHPSLSCEFCLKEGIEDARQVIPRHRLLKWTKQGRVDGTGTTSLWILASSPFAAQSDHSCNSPSTASYICGGSLYNHAKPVNCPRVMAKHACLHSECCKCGLGVGIPQYYSALATPNKDRDTRTTAPVSLASEVNKKEEPIWDPNWNCNAALTNSSYPMLTTEYLNDRMSGLIQQQEEEALALYEKMRDAHLRGQLEEIGEEAYSEGGFDMFTTVGNYLQNASKYLRMEKITEFPYRYGHCVSCFDFDSTGGLLAIGGSAKVVRIFDFEDQLRDYHKYSLLSQSNALLEIAAVSKLSGLAWCKTDAQNLVMTEYDGVATLYDVNAGQETRRYKDHNRRIWDVAFAHEQRRFATCGDDGKLFLYNTATPTPIHAVDVGFSATSVEFCPWNEHELAVGVSDATVNIYDTRFTKQQFMQLRGHRKAVSYVRYLNCPGKQRLLSAAIDSSIQMWNLEDGSWKCERTFKGHVNEKNFTGLATNGEHFVAGSEGNDIVLYHQFFSKPMAKCNFLKNADREFSEFDEQHDRNDFISCLKWKRGTNIFVAGNNQGLIQAYKAH